MSPNSPIRTHRDDFEGINLCDSYVNDRNNVKNVNGMLNNNRNEGSNEENGTRVENFSLERRNDL